MRFKAFCICFVIISLAFSSVYGQILSNFKQQSFTLPDTSSSLKLDSLSLIQGSVIISIDSIQIDSSAFAIDFFASILKLKPAADSLSGKEVTISYRTFPFSFGTVYRRKDLSLLNPTVAKNPFAFVPGKEKTDVFKTEGLQKNGSISRGISFGNNQDVVVNSSLNLQLSGKISDDVEILAAITDDNIPIQPEGNTQQLQEFDRVYIQLSKEQTKLIAGDFQLERPESYFLNYYKRAQGGSLSTAYTVPLDGNRGPIKGTSSISAAVSKGKFARNVIPGIEGNQGPYRLRGAENELFIIVLAGTERIYIDGMLMERGQEFDYVIDYNTAEVTFTSNRLITKDKRIVAEFQYSERNYARSLVQASTKAEQGNLKLIVNVFSEEDNKNKPLLQDLSDDQKLLLENIGDNLNQAVTPKIDSIPFTADQVLYEKRDTIVDGILLTYYLYSTNPETARYRLGFSSVGEGNGNYVVSNSTANGRVYRWIPPVNGKKGGTHEPVVLLITPKRKQMATLGAEYQINDNGRITTEGAFSKNDLNTFSDFDRHDDNGNALRVTYLQKIKGEKVLADSTFSVTTLVDYERVDKNFSPIERFRNVEFERDWNRRSVNILESQHISTASVRLDKLKTGFVSYALSSFVEEKDVYNGLKHQVNSSLAIKKLTLAGFGSLLNTQDTISTSTFLRHKLTATLPVSIFEFGGSEEQERNQFSFLQSDSLHANSFNFQEYQLFAKTDDTLKTTFGINLTQRTDFAPVNDNFKRATLGRSINVNSGIFLHANHQIKTNTTYRTLDILDTLLTSSKPDNTLLSRIEYGLKLFKGAITSTVFYELGSGLEAKREFSFLEVAAGQGVYTWKDYNENGVKELNEFETAMFPDQRRYIKIFTPTNSYVKAYSNQYNQVLMINPAAVWSSANGIKKLLSRFSDQAGYRIERKTNSSEVLLSYNPFANETVDPNLISMSSSFRNTLFFNRNSQVFGADLNFQDSRNKTLLVNGFDSRINNQKGVTARYNVTRVITIQETFNYGFKKSVSDYFSNRQFKIVFYETEPKLIYQPSTVFRVMADYRYADKKDVMREDQVTAFFNSTGAEVKYNILTEGSLQGRVNMIHIKYNGSLNSPLAFEMLEGLQNGVNYTWTLSYQRNLANNMQISLNYEGRKSENIRAIHTGGVQVRAFF